MIRIILIRHGQTEGNLKKRYIGTTDEDLCAEGMMQVLGKRDLFLKLILPQPDSTRETVMVSSPMKRCLQTAELILGKEMDQKTLLIEDSLRECDFGKFENRNYIEMAGDPEYQQWIDSGGLMPFPGGESQGTFQERTCRGFERFLERYFRDDKDPDSPDRNVILTLFVHGGTIMSLMDRYCASKKPYYEWMVGNAEGYAGLLRKTDHSWVIESEEKI